MRKYFSLLLPFSLTAGILLLDQITKALVLAYVPPGTIAWRFLGDWFWLVRQQNLGIAFSMGDSLPGTLRLALFIGLPLILVVGVVVFYFKSKEITAFQRWILCGIIGGGLGNLIDRAFRPEGVVDFMSFKFWGIFGMERWPTENFADISVVVSAVLLALTTIVADARRKP